MHDTLALHTYNSLKDVVAVPTAEAFANFPSEFVKVSLRQSKGPSIHPNAVKESYSP